MMTTSRANDGITGGLAVCFGGGKYTGFGSILRMVHPLAVLSMAEFIDGSTAFEARSGGCDSNHDYGISVSF
jgi:hypothetical protein